MAIEINGKLEPNAFSHIQIPKGKVTFHRLNVKPLIKFTDKGQKESFTSSVGIPMYFQTTLKTVPNNNGEVTGLNGAIEVRYYNTRSEQMVMGQRAIEYQPTSVDIVGLSKTLDMSRVPDQEMYKVLMIHPLNTLNAALNGKQPVFELFEAQKLSTAANNKEKERNKAVALAYNESEVPNSLCEKIHRTLSEITDEYLVKEDYESIRSDVAVYARQNPAEFNKMVADASLGVRGELKSAIDKGIIVLEKDRVWKWGNTKAVKNNKIITEVSVGEDPFDDLVLFMRTNNKSKATLEFIRTEIENWGVPATA